MLAILLLHANEVVAADRLIDLIWGERPPATAPKALQVHVSQLRKVLAPKDGEQSVLVTAPPGYLLRVRRDGLDLHRFENLVSAAHRALAEGAPADAAEALAEALALWRGEPLADFRLEPFAQLEIARLEEMRLAAKADAAETNLALGRHSDAIAELEALLARHPTRERLAHLLMFALYRSGRQADALDVYRQVRAALVGQLGIEPGADLQEMQRKVLAQDDSLRWVPARSRSVPNNLPMPSTSFVGRAREVARVGELLRTHRLVTLTGPGGCGKSRLALEQAIAALPARPHGVWLVELASLGDGALVATTIATALGVKEDAELTASEATIAAIGGRSALLVLDDCEHVIEG
ncbi:MAG: AfsR/SARP family transcriptional regulator, partial [Solirubrobacterales bacterium]|nr:AfsR/SARP family transcriptional regulator [Solirubrobacterales bacterium]